MICRAAMGALHGLPFQRKPFDTPQRQCYADVVQAIPLVHGASGILDEIILIIEGIVVVALLVAYLRGRRRGNLPPDESSPTRVGGGGSQPRR